MKKINSKYLLLFLFGLVLASCDFVDDFVGNTDDDAGDEDPLETTVFDITITNLINFFNTTIYNVGDGADAPGSINQPGDSFTVQFQAVPDARMSFVSMSSESNDWIFAPRGTGIELFDADGNALLGYITDQVLLWDVGTEEENPDTFGGGNPDLREPDDDNTVRIVSEDTSPYLKVELTEYDEATRTFTMVITNLRGVDTQPTPIRISPGIVLTHVFENPFFTEGEPDRGQGLQLLAERGDPNEIDAFFNELGTDGAPIRLASSYSTISPGIAYAFNSESDPWFTQGEPMGIGSGVEELAEAGNNQIAFDYLNSLGVTVVQSEEDINLEPGESLNFTIEVPNDPSYRLGFGTMLVSTNDWFMSFNNSGVPLFNEDGTPFSGTSESDEIYLFDAGTEEDELVGIGDFLGSTPGPIDDNPIIRRVTSIDDQQFGKGVISSPPGTAWLGDPRGGYNLLEVDIQPR